LGEQVIGAVRSFWEKNPLFQGESNFKPGTPEFFEEHRRVYIEDCFAGAIDPRLFPDSTDCRTLDLGCGPGFWTVEFLKSGIKNVVAADLTQNALNLTRKRLLFNNVNAEVVRENAEKLAFPSNAFDHINCQGVIHHTPNTGKCIAEIARVLKPGGGAIISVYYRNIFLRHWNKLKLFGKLLSKFDAKLHGRGRENIFSQNNVNEIVRMYDGKENPIGKAYSKQEFMDMLNPYFDIEEIFFHFFPARALPLPIPKILHKWLDKNVPFMIFAKLRKER